MAMIEKKALTQGSKMTNPKCPTVFRSIYKISLSTCHDFLYFCGKKHQQKVNVQATNVIMNVQGKKEILDRNQYKR